MYTISTGHIIITPQKAVPLAGFAERKQIYETIADDLEINLIIIKEGDHTFLLYSIDTFFVPEDFVQSVIHKYGSTYKLDESRVWMCATHTHFAPSLDAEKPRMGVCDEVYYSFVKDRLLSLTADVLQSAFTEVDITYGTGSADINVNRRKKLLRPANGQLKYKTLLLPDYKGAKDSTLHLVNLVGKQGNVMARLWSYACHPVHAYNRNSVSAEYIGAIRSEMRQHAGDDNLTVGFFQGFAGNLKADITAVTNTRVTDAIRYMLQLWPAHVSFPSQQAYRKWIGILWSKLVPALSQDNTIAITGGIAATLHRIPLSSIIGDRENASLVFKKLKFGDRLAFVSISAEVVTEYTTLLRKVMQEEHVVGVGYTEATRTYLPVDSMLSEGGYEVEGFKPLFGIEGEFKYSLDKKIAKALTALNNAS